MMTPRQIITGRSMNLPSYCPRSCVFAIRGDTTNSVDLMRSFVVLYLPLNDDGDRYFVYNIETMQRCSVCTVFGINKKSIPMTANVIDTINKQAGEETNRIEVADINVKTTVNDFEARDNDSESDFEDNDKSYETSDDSIVKGNNDQANGIDQLKEDYQQHFNLQEVNDTNENDSDNGDKGLEENKLDETASVYDNAEVEQKIEEKDGLAKIEDEDGSVIDENASRPNSSQGDVPSIELVESVVDGDNVADVL